MNSHAASYFPNTASLLAVTGLCSFPFISSYSRHPLTLSINQVAKLTNKTDCWVCAKGTRNLEEIYLLVLPTSTEQLYNLSGQYYGMDYLLYGGQKQVDPDSLASGLAVCVGTASNLLGKAQLCFQNMDGWGLSLGWLNDSFCNYTLNFNQTSLGWDPWSEEDEYGVHKGNFTLYWGTSRMNATKKYINEDHITINSSDLGTEYAGIGMTTRQLLNLTSLQDSLPKYNIIQLIFRNLLCQSPHHTHNQSEPGLSPLCIDDCFHSVWPSKYNPRPWGPSLLPEENSQ